MTKILECGNGNIGFEEIDIPKTKSELEFAELLKSYSVERVKTNKEYTGTLIDKNEKYFVFDINNKSSVYVPRDTNENLVLDNLEFGDTKNILITNVIDKKDYSIYGSVYAIVLNDLYDYLAECTAEKSVLSGTPIEMNHAGYTIETVVNDQEINLFMPHLLTDMNKLPNPESLIGQENNFLLKEINKDGQTQYIATRKAYLKTLFKQEMKSLYINQECLGVVTGTTKFGIFVQFNTCLTAMIHKSNLSEDGKKMFDNQTIEPGMQLPFIVKSIDNKKNRVFGTQILSESLWDKLEIGHKLTGKINNIKPFGLLVDLDYETKGLIHKSNMENKQYTIGDSVEVKVTNVNKSNRQVTLNFA